MKSRMAPPRPSRQLPAGRTFLFACLAIAFVLARVSVAPPPARGAGEPLAYYVQLKQDIKTAANAGDKQALARLLEGVKQRLQPAGPEAYLNYYYAAYINDRIVYLIRLKKDGDNPHKYLDEGIAHLEKAIKLKPDFTEGYILLASLYGQKAMDEMVASFFGPKSTYMVTKALKLEPDNPRAHLIEAIGKYFTPRAYGGDPEKALQSLEKARKGFTNYQNSDAASPDWGQAETYAWLAQIRGFARDYPGSREALKAGLALDPENLWLKTLEKQLLEQEKTAPQKAD